MLVAERARLVGVCALLTIPAPLERLRLWVLSLLSAWPTGWKMATGSALPLTSMESSTFQLQPQLAEALHAS